MGVGEWVETVVDDGIVGGDSESAGAGCAFRSKDERTNERTAVEVGWLVGWLVAWLVENSWLVEAGSSLWLAACVRQALLSATMMECRLTVA